VTESPAAIKILNWEDDRERVWVSYNSSEYLQERHDIPDDLMQSVRVVETLAGKTAE
jgi:uncharacterized protein (DUF302 family)